MLDGKKRGKRFLQAGIGESGFVTSKTSKHGGKCKSPRPASQQVPPGCLTVNVTHLPTNVTQDELRILFKRATKVNMVSPCKARITFLMRRDVEAALGMHGMDCNGNPMHVEPDFPEEASQEANGYELCLKNLPGNAKEEEIQKRFSSCGKILGGVRLLRNPASGECKGVGWLTFEAEVGLAKAMEITSFIYGGRRVQLTAATKTWSGIRGSLQATGTHTPAMVEEMMRALVLPDPDGTYVDGTFGRGGHSRAILARLTKHGRVHAFDLDPEAVTAARLLEMEDSRFTIHHRPFGHLEMVLRDEGIAPSGVFLDLGISSPQFDEAHRGFRPEADGPLDLRFDQTRGESAWELLNRIDRVDLAALLVENGEADKAAARRIADAIALRVARGDLPRRTKEFAELVSQAKGAEYQAMHPAKLTFQALRIQLNQEFDEIRRGMVGALKVMALGGRLGLLTWKHSECGIVMDIFRDYEAARDEFPMYRWLQSEHPELVANLKAKSSFSIEPVMRPSQKEIQENSRARSALLHIFRKHKAVRTRDVERAAYKVLGWGAPPPMTPTPPPREW